MGLDKYSAGSFEEMAEAQESAPETAEKEAKTEVGNPTVSADNNETSKSE